MVETEQGNDVYVLTLWECFGERSICGVYTSKLKLIDGYQRIMEGNVRCSPFSVEPREPAIYRFHTNEFIGEAPEWNDGKLYIDDQKHEISIRELKEKVDIIKADSKNRALMRELNRAEQESHHVHYFLMSGYDEFHDDDDWLGIYHDWRLARDAYYKAAGQLEEEHQRWHDEFTIKHEKIMIHIFDETTGKWDYNVDPNLIFPPANAKGCDTDEPQF